MRLLYRILALVMLIFLFRISVAAQTSFTVGTATAAPGQKSTGYLEVPVGVDAGTSIPVVVNDQVVAMTGSPGGDNGGLPIVSKGQEATMLFTDGKFSYIELPDGTRGWVPAPSVVPK